MQGDRHDVVPAMEAYPVHHDHGMRLWWFGGPSYAIRTTQSIVYIDSFHLASHLEGSGIELVIPTKGESPAI
jgi:hypothetical protein